MKWDILGRVLSALGILSLIAGPLTGRPPLAAAGIAIGVALIVGASLLWWRHRYESPEWQWSRRNRGLAKQDDESGQPGCKEGVSLTGRTPVTRGRWWSSLAVVFLFVGSWWLVEGIISPSLFRFMEAAVFFCLAIVAYTRLRHLPDSN